MPYAVLAAALVALDQLVKYLVSHNIPLGGHVPLLPHLVELTYFQNTGAAFSMLEEHTWLLTLISAVMSVVLGVAVWKKFFAHPFGRCALTLVLAGAVGNLIDRMVQSYVVDFLYFKLIDFPIFNVADCYVTAGAILLAILILFVYKDEELGFLSLKKKHE